MYISERALKYSCGCEENICTNATKLHASSSSTYQLHPPHLRNSQRRRSIAFAGAMQELTVNALSQNPGRRDVQRTAVKTEHLPATRLQTRSIFATRKKGSETSTEHDLLLPRCLIPRLLFIPISAGSKMPSPYPEGDFVSLSTWLLC